MKLFNPPPTPIWLECETREHLESLSVWELLNLPLGSINFDVFNRKPPKIKIPLVH